MFLLFNPMQFTTKFISKKKLILIVGGLLITGVAIFAAQWRWHFWHSANENTQSVMSESSVLEDNLLADENALPETGNALRDVLAANLFGLEGEVKKVVNSAEPVPKTQQPLELHGIFFIPNHPEQTVALIAQAGGEAKKYKTGADIESLPGWKVLEILPNSVRIGQEEPGEILPLLAVNPSQMNNASPMNPMNQFPNEVQDNSSPEDNVAAPEESAVPDNTAPVDESIPQDNAVPPPGNMPVPNNAAPTQNPQDSG
jgi:hypothetical protein